MGEHFDFQEVKRGLPFLRLMEQEGFDLKRSGANWIMPCPFHAERTSSFTVHAPDFDHGHCYGCAWNGDIFDFWRERHGGDFLSAVRALASRASISPTKRDQPAGHTARPPLSPPASPVPGVTDVASRPRQKPALPRLRALTSEEIERLAALRKLSVAGIAAAAADKRVAACAWPQFQDYHECWRTPDDATMCWVVTDSARAVAQFRRLDGKGFVRHDGREIKAWSKGSPTWPIGANEIGARGAVLLVEGGADMLAAYHFLALFHRLADVAVCAMLGASMRIAADALPFFERKRVRIVMDEDEAKDERGTRAGYEAAARWSEQLVNAGAAVETFSLSGLVKKDGSKVKDLNDLAEVDEGAWGDDELREAFFDFDF